MGDDKSREQQEREQREQQEREQGGRDDKPGPSQGQSQR